MRETGSARSCGNRAVTGLESTEGLAEGNHLSALYPRKAFGWQPAAMPGCGLQALRGHAPKQQPPQVRGLCSLVEVIGCVGASRPADEHRLVVRWRAGLIACGDQAARAISTSLGRLSPATFTAITRNQYTRYGSRSDTVCWRLEVRATVVHAGVPAGSVVDICTW